MSTLTRFSFSPPQSLKGLAVYAPQEMREFVLNLIARAEANQTALITAMKEQLIADPALLPEMVRGEVAASTTTVATTRDTEEAVLLGMML